MCHFTPARSKLGARVVEPKFMNTPRALPYISHLLQACEIQTISACKDINATDGTVLITKGSVIRRSDEETLKHHTLSANIETLIELEHEFSAADIEQLLVDFLASDPGFERILARRDLQEKFRAAIAEFCMFPVLRQKLTIFALQMPEMFDQACFCAWLSVTAYANQNYPQDVLDKAFIASITHDFGYLHIEPSILFKETSLSTEEWLEMQQHTEYSRQILKSIPSFDRDVIKAVYQHHEVIDGTGYPKGNVGKQISELAQVLNLLDTANAIYKKHFFPRGRSLHDMTPLLRIATSGVKSSHTEQIFTLFNTTPHTENCIIPDQFIKDVIDFVKQQVTFVNNFLQCTNKFKEDVGHQHGHLKILMLQKMAGNISYSMQSCGIINEAYLRWLDQVEKEKLIFAYRELEDVILMAQEIIYHIQKFHRQVDIYLNETEQGALKEKVKVLQNALQNIPKTEANESLARFLQGKHFIDSNKNEGGDGPQVK